MFYPYAKDKFSKLNPEANNGVLLGYSTTSKSYRVYNLQRKIIEETIHVSFKELKNNQH